MYFEINKQIQQRSKAATPPPRLTEKYDSCIIAHGVANIVCPPKSSKMLKSSSWEGSGRSGDVLVRQIGSRFDKKTNRESTNVGLSAPKHCKFQSLSKIFPKSSKMLTWGVLGCLWLCWGRFGASCSRLRVVFERLG